MYIRGAGLLVAGASSVLGVLVFPDGAPLDDWAGLVQRILILTVLFPARLAIAHRLRRVSQGGRLSPEWNGAEAERRPSTTR